jgi:hypothetical protein
MHENMFDVGNVVTGKSDCWMFVANRHVYTALKCSHVSCAFKLILLFSVTFRLVVGMHRCDVRLDINRTSNK